MTNPIDYLLLVDKSKEDLLQIILSQSQQISELQAQVKELQEQVKKDKDSTNKPIFFKSKKKKRRKKPGRKNGHIGCTRRKPEEIDREEISVLDECPDCGCKDITELPSEDREHVQEYLVPAEVETVKFIRKGYWCPCCKDKKHAPYLPEAVPYGYLGPMVLVGTIVMKYHYGLSFALL